jgi:hypothetical protein
MILWRTLVLLISLYALVLLAVGTRAVGARLQPPGETEAPIAAARAALASGDLAQARALAERVDTSARTLQELVRQAERVRDARNATAAFDAALRAGSWSEIDDAYGDLHRSGDIPPEYAAAHERAHRREIDRVRAAAQAALSAHECVRLREIDDQLTRLDHAFAIDTSERSVRCERERSASDVVRDAAAGVEIEARDRLKLLELRGPERLHALRVLGVEQCKGDQRFAERVLSALGGDDREAFAIGCALSEAMPKPESGESNDRD